MGAIQPAEAAETINFQDLSTCADEYLPLLPESIKIQKCFFTGQTVNFVNSYFVKHPNSSMNITEGNSSIKQVKTKELSLNFDKPGQYSFAVTEVGSGATETSLVSEKFYVLDPRLIQSSGVGTASQSQQSLKQSYIVVFKDASIIASLKELIGFTPKENLQKSSNLSSESNLFYFKSKLKSGAIGQLVLSLTQAEYNLLKLDSRIFSIQKNRILTLSGVQNNPTWNLDRIDQPSLPLNGNYAYPDSAYAPTVYVLDTGINYNHIEFTGRFFDCMWFTSLTTDGND